MSDGHKRVDNKHQSLRMTMEVITSSICILCYGMAQQISLFTGGCGGSCS